MYIALQPPIKKCCYISEYTVPARLESFSQPNRTRKEERCPIKSRTQGAVKLLNPSVEGGIPACVCNTLRSREVIRRNV